MALSPAMEFDEEFFEWEERKSDVPFQNHLIAGSAAGVVEHCALLPLDSIKTHRQSLLVPLTLPDTIKHIRNQPGGILNFWRGSMIMAMGCIPAHAIFFSIYEFSQKKMGLHHTSHYNFNIHAMIGALSSAFHDLIMLPCEGRVASYGSY